MDAKKIPTQSILINGSIEELSDAIADKVADKLKIQQNHLPLKDQWLDT